jgi:cytochrome b subunit of formate dehydrogenase
MLIFTPDSPMNLARSLLAGIFTALLLPLVAGAQDETCLACHGERELRGERGQSISVDPAKYKAGVHNALRCVTCHAAAAEIPHPKRMPRLECSACHAEAPADVAGSAHGIFGPQACSTCHGSVHEAVRAARIVPQQCAPCHAEAVRDFQGSVHTRAKSQGDPDAPSCQSCHGPIHKVVPSREIESRTSRRQLPDTCGACHANPEFLARHKIPFARPVEAFRLSVHGRAVERGVENAASCSDCHASHAIFPAREERSLINHWKVPQTCGACHTQIRDTYLESVHGQAVERGVRASPVCTDCHGEHSILAPGEPGSLVNPARVSSVTCGRCHSDERLAARFGLPLDKVPAFEDSYHGLALRAGSQTVANCASCHGVHNILPSSDPRSTVHPANLAATCGSCHPGAGTRFALGPVHIRPATASEHVVVKSIRWAYWIIIPFTLAFMLFHHLLDFFAKLIRGTRRLETGEEVERMNLHFRIAHWLTVLSFPVLVITGFALKFPDSWWAHPILRWESEFALRGTVHRVAGVVLLASFFYHIAHLIVSRRDRAILRFMRPGIQDARDLLGVFRYNLGLSADRPVFGKFSYVEKIEYLAFMWGTAVMAASGVMLWANNFMLRNFPKWVLDAAQALHYYEAILATFAILIWHFYTVIFDPEVYPMDRAWLTGRTSADHLKHTRPAYYLELVSAQRAPEAEAETASADAAPDGPAQTESPQPASSEPLPPGDNEKKT